MKFASGDNRGWACPIDWDTDGKSDVILRWSGGPCSIYLNRGMSDSGLPKFEIVPVKNQPWMPHPRPLALDWDRDGDIDMLWASSYSLLHFASRDLIEGGYRPARVVGR